MPSTRATGSSSGYGVSQAMAGVIAASGVSAAPGSPEAQVAKMRTQVQQMQAEVAAAKDAAKLRAARVEQRQALISAVLTGDHAPVALDGAVAVAAPQTGSVANEVLAPLRKVEQRGHRRVV